MNQPSTPNGFLKTFKIIHLAFTGVIFMFSMVTLILVKDYKFIAFDTTDVFYILVPIVVVCGVILSNFLFQKNLSTIDPKDLLQNQLAQYQSTSLIKYALIEGPALLSLVTFILTENILFLIIALILILYLFSLRPTKQRIIEDLKLNHELKNLFDNNRYNN
jgi:hypothetical protein